MYYVYVLKGENGKLYIGRSDNLRNRIKDHIDGKVYTTKRMLNPKLFYYEAYTEKEASQEREKKLKQFGSSYNGLLKRLRLK
ncbi:MAG: GIY-YIG nuclease family protein [Candidatus Levybacteria bacterium]|nr:GIY-YIG nuclease family protein [Candidatus Levybacteria bacterium]